MKLCECGCGLPTNVIQCSRPGLRKGEHYRFLRGHANRLIKRGSGNGQRWAGGRQTTNGYVMVWKPDDPRTQNGYMREHVLISEHVLGRPLPSGAEVHHVNGIRDDNRPGNLVICQDKAYHLRLHQRTRALDACGHADWLRCTYCKRYDDPANMYIKPNNNEGHHRECANERRRQRKLERRGIDPRQYRGDGHRVIQ